MAPAIELRELSFHYPDGSEALSRVSLSISPGECVALVGPNGAGKSTILLHLNGLLPDGAPSKGAVLIAGRVVDKASLPAIRKSVGLLFQDADDQIFCASVAEDVGFGPRQFGEPESRIEEIVRASLARVGLGGFERRSPQRLSAGEKRRVCLAGVLACDPAVLALDEPTSTLDPRGRRELINLLARIPATRVIATHDLEMVLDLCPRTILLDQGQVVADGPSEEILDNEALMLAHGLERPHSLLHRHPHR
ncbi:MAG: ABC transporter ATP-binding protein [Planctomycetota bacterium]|nr:ABC transporter ATP-binding protein [Planctomycetota bacterium]